MREDREGRLAQRWLALDGDGKIDGYQTPLFVRHHRRHEPEDGKETYLRNVLFENIRGTADSRIACSMTGLSDLRPQHICLRNIDLVFPGGGTDEDVKRPVRESERGYPESFMFGTLPAYGLYVRHVDDLQLENVNLSTRAPDARPPVVYNKFDTPSKKKVGVSSD